MSRSIFNGMGYLLADCNMPMGQRTEADMLACFHCQTAMRRHLWADDGGFCHACDGPVCGPCSDRQLTEGCANFRAKLEKALDKDYRRRQIAMVAGSET